MFTVKDYNKSIKDKPQLGVQIFWSLHTARYNTVAVKKALENSGIGLAYLQCETLATSFMSATAQVARENGSQILRVKDDSDHETFRIIKLSADNENEKVKVDQETAVSFRKKDGSIYGEGDMALIDEVREKFAFFKETIPDSKLRLMFTWLLRDEGHCVNLRPSGGIYFIPRQHTAVVEKLDKLTNELKLGAIYPMGIVDGKAEKQAAAVFVKEDLKGRLEEIRKAALEKENVRVSTLIRAKDGTKVVSELYEMYQELLDGETLAEEIQELCQTMQNKLTERIVKMDKSGSAPAAKAEKKAAPKKTKSAKKN